MREGGFIVPDELVGSMIKEMRRINELAKLDWEPPGDCDCEACLASEIGFNIFGVREQASTEPLTVRGSAMPYRIRDDRPFRETR